MAALADVVAAGDGPDETSRVALAARFSAVRATNSQRAAYDRFGET